MSKEYERKVKVINELTDVINRNSLENDSNTPDFILAEYLYYCLESFNWASRRRETWYGKELKIGMEK